MVTLMGFEHVNEVAGIHQSVLTDSIYTWIGRPFLEYYYRNLLKNDGFFCHVYTFNGKVVGFLASTSAARRVFFRQLRRDTLGISAVLVRILAREPRKIGVILSASRFLFMERPAMMPHVEGEILSFAVFPEYRTVEIGTDGIRRPTGFYAERKISVAAELFFSAMRNLASYGVHDVKIMTPADNVASNRFYSKFGCRLVAEGVIVFDHPTNLYYGRIEDIVSREEARTRTGYGRIG